MSKLSPEFYARDTLTVARELLGKYLVRVGPSGLLAGRILETEAYTGPEDKACHTYGGRRTPRTEVMFGPPGRAYIYFIYGMYHCLNFVTEPEGTPCAVLIRSLEPALGLDGIARLRFKKPYAALISAQRKNLLNGPGKLCRGMDITRALNGADLAGDTLYVCDSSAHLGLPEPPSRPVACGPRIGIDYAEEARDWPYRFYYL